MTKEEYIDFLNLDYLIPIDDIIEFDGRKFKLSKNYFYSFLSCARIREGYDVNFDKKIDKKIAKDINQKTHSGICGLCHSLEYNIKRNEIHLLRPNIIEILN